MKRIPHIAAVMTPFPYTIDADAALLRARHMMHERDVRHLPVSRNGELVGILSDRDIKRALDPGLGLPPEEELFVEDVMVRDPYVVETRTPLDEVLDQMAEERLGSALVVKQEKLVGVFTVSDACRAFAHILRSGGDIPDEVA
ncbi:MAG: CBS domain-containing protein [Myxococcota bacterium]|nr:CBS domain-containing protein [Myxococcota bacterium]